MGSIKNEMSKNRTIKKGKKEIYKRIDCSYSTGVIDD